MTKQEELKFLDAVISDGGFGGDYISYVRKKQHILNIDGKELLKLISKYISRYLVDGNHRITQAIHDYRIELLA